MQPKADPSFRRRPESMDLKILDSGLRRNDDLENDSLEKVDRQDRGVARAVTVWLFSMTCLIVMVLQSA